MKPNNVFSLQAYSRKKKNEIDVQQSSDQNVKLDSLVWLSSKEAARYLRKSYGALKVMVSRGQVRARKFNRRLYFRRRELDHLLETSEHVGGI